MVNVMNHKLEKLEACLHNANQMELTKFVIKSKLLKQQKL